MLNHINNFHLKKYNSCFVYTVDHVKYYSVIHRLTHSLTHSQRPKGSFSNYFQEKRCCSFKIRNLIVFSIYSSYIIMLNYINKFHLTKFNSCFVYTVDHRNENDYSVIYIIMSHKGLHKSNYT